MIRECWIAASGFALFFLASHAPAATLDGKVVKVADGDTVTVLVGREQHRVRLQGIDWQRPAWIHPLHSGSGGTANVSGHRACGTTTCGRATARRFP